MTNEELLLAMSDMLDKKLKTELQPIKDHIQMLKTDVQTLKNDVQMLKADVQTLQTDVHTLQTDVQALQTDVHALQTDVQVLQTDVQALQTDVHILQTDVRALQADVRQVQLFQENIILPRLNTIESCYTHTYHRYAGCVEQMESTFDDVKILKKAVADHTRMHHVFA